MFTLFSSCNPKCQLITYFYFNNILFPCPQMKSTLQRTMYRQDMQPCQGDQIRLYHMKEIRWKEIGYSPTGVVFR